MQSHLSRKRIALALRPALLTLVALGCATRALALPTLEQLMGDFAFRTEDVQRVRDGELVKTIAEQTSENEIAAVMVFLVHAPVQTLVSSFEVGRSFGNDPQVKAVSEINGDGTLADFKSIGLDPGAENEARRYLDAVPGDTLNLSPSEIALFTTLKTNGNTTPAAVEAVLRRMLLARYQAYRSQGLTGIGVYARADGKKTQPAADLRRETEAAQGLKKYVPLFYDVLLRYPRTTYPGLNERFFCIHYSMGERPNFTLRQRLTMPVEDAYVVADREFYVAHDYNQSQAIAALLPVEDGTVVLYLNRTTTDQIGGFAPAAKQAIGSSLMASQISAIFEKGRAGLKGK